MKIERSDTHEHLIEELPGKHEIRASRLHGDSRWNIYAPDKPPIKFYGTVERVMKRMHEVRLPNTTIVCAHCGHLEVHPPQVVIPPKAACPECHKKGRRGTLTKLEAT